MLGVLSLAAGGLAAVAGGVSGAARVTPPTGAALRATLPAAAITPYTSAAMIGPTLG